MPRLESGVHLAVDPVALDPMPGNELAQQGEAFEGDLPHAACGVGTYQSRDLGATGRNTWHDLTAVTPGGSPADAVLFQQHHLVATLGQMQGRRAAGDPTTDDANVAVDVAPQGRATRGGVRCGGVIRAGMRKRGQEVFRIW